MVDKILFFLEHSLLPAALVLIIGLIVRSLLLKVLKKVLERENRKLDRAVDNVILTVVNVAVWLIIIFTITGWVGIFRLARATMLSIREEEYVQALHAFGLNDAIICFKHMLPNALAPIIVNITINMASMILEEAALSFLGLGVPMQIPTWGNILNASQDMYTLEKAWWMWAPVGTTITLFVMSINFIGDGIRDMTDTSVQG